MKLNNIYYKNIKANLINILYQIVIKLFTIAY